jgi:acetoin utilization deacetylase AcuC-like enzyme
MALVLEGGYDLVALESGMRSAVDGMLGAAAPVEPGRAADDEGVERAARAAQKAWAGVT